jgi:hypothetical protein
MCRNLRYVHSCGKLKDTEVDVNLGKYISAKESLGYHELKPYKPAFLNLWSVNVRGGPQVDVKI